MQLLQLLTEQADRQQEVVELINLIKQAKPFFDQRGDDPSAWLYRGVKPQEVPQTLGQAISPREDRKPTDSAGQTHTMLDNRLFQEFGIKYRSSATFVAGDLDHAGDYGRVCIVLPQGPFKYVYAKNVRDAYGKFRARKLRSIIADSPEAQSIDLTELKAMNGNTRYDEQAMMDWIDRYPILQQIRDKWFEETYASCNYVSPDNIMDGLLSGNEIMLHCEKVAVIPYQQHVHPDVVSMVEKYINARFDLGMDGGTPNTKQLINLMLPYIFK